LGINRDSIYSYYVEKGDEIFREELTDHVKEALSTIPSKQSKISQYIEKMLGRVDISFADAVRLSIIFHDIGKIFYQKNYKYDKKHNVRYLSFTGHEFLSSYIFNKFTFYLANSEALSKMLSACNFSILFHHHAMNPRCRASLYRKPAITVGKAAIDEVKIEKLKILNQFLNSSEVGPWRDTINNVRVEVEKSKDVNVFIEGVVNSMFSQQGLGSKIWRIFIGDPIFRKTSLALLSTLLVADYLSALKLRPKSKPTTFHNVLREFYSYYLSNTFTEPKNKSKILS
jgi:CRISPR-associated endonuclease Cas3-HD